MQVNSRICKHTNVIMLILCKLWAASRWQPSAEWCLNTALHWMDESRHRCNVSSHTSVTGFLALRDTATKIQSVNINHQLTTNNCWQSGYMEMQARKVDTSLTTFLPFLFPQSLKEPICHRTGQYVSADTRQTLIGSLCMLTSSTKHSSCGKHGHDTAKFSQWL